MFMLHRRLAASPGSEEAHTACLQLDLV